MNKNARLQNTYSNGNEDEWITWMVDCILHLRRPKDPATVERWKMKECVRSQGNVRHAVSCAGRHKASLLLLFTNFVSRCTMLWGKAWHFYAKRVKLIVQIFVRKQRMRILIRHRGPRSMLTHRYVGNTKMFRSNCQAAEPEWDRTSSSIFPRTGSANTN